MWCRNADAMWHGEWPDSSLRGILAFLVTETGAIEPFVVASRSSVFKPFYQALKARGLAITEAFVIPARKLFARILPQ